MEIELFGKRYDILENPDGSYSLPEELEQIRGGSALKPAWEPVILCRKPLDGTVAANVARWGCGALAIDACRIEYASEADRAQAIVPQPKARPDGRDSGHALGSGVGRNGEMFDPGAGRWPANVLLDEEAAAALDEAVGDRPSTLTGRADGPAPNPSKARGKRNVLAGNGGGGVVYADSGGPSRFFYTAKVSTKERNAGCEHLPKRSAGEVTEREDRAWQVWSDTAPITEFCDESEARAFAAALAERTSGASIEVRRVSAGLDNPRAGAGRGGGAHNHHPTLKPLALTEYLARLLMPPVDDARLLVPFAGSGSEVIGALLAGWRHVDGIEREEEYVEIARARIAHWTKPKAA